MYTLSRNELITILKNADPQVALDLCSTSSEFRRLCNDPYVMRQLLEYHFPGEENAADPVVRFRELARDSIVTLYFWTKKNSTRAASTSFVPRKVQPVGMKGYKVMIYRKHVDVKKFDLYVVTSTNGRNQAFANETDAIAYASQIDDPGPIIHVKGFGRERRRGALGLRRHVIIDDEGDLL